MRAFVNCDIYTGDEIYYNRAILVNGDMIVGVVPESQVPENAEIEDLRGLSIAPGFIDVQVNGGGGVLFNEHPTLEGIERIALAHQQFGTTNFLPTLMTGPQDVMVEAIQALQEFLTSGRHEVLGIHLEGPFINSKRAGVHDPSFIRVMDDEDLDMVSALRGGKTVITLAPEKVESKYIQEMKERGVLVSAGHTDASYSEMQDAIRSGVTGATHLFNAMTALQSRDPGVVGSALENDSIYCGIIVDGNHIHFATVKVAWKAKPSGRMFLVTDAMPSVGSDVRSFSLGQFDVRVEDGKLMTGDGVLAGSGLDMASAVRNCVQKVGIPKDEALRMASTYPAQFLGMGQALGRIQPGYRADMAVFDNEIRVSAVVVAGEYRLSECGS
jgi:N-acetylglucosamine-6-phosphate deacetylase